MRIVLILGILLTCVVTHYAHAEQLVVLSLGADQKIVVYSLDADAGTLAQRNSIDTVGKPGAMCVSRDGKRLYVALKGTNSIAAYTVNHVGLLQPLGESPIGASASYLSIDPSGRFLASAYYSTGQVAIHSIEEGGELSDRPLQKFDTDERAHCIVFDRSGNFAVVPHTRPNAIFQFHFDKASGLLSPNDPVKILRDADTGPRHLWFHDSNQLAFGSDEQGSSITAYQFDDQLGRLKAIQTLSSLPDGGFQGRNSTSDIEVHPSGKFAYIANRGHDTIAGYSIDAETGKLMLIGHTPTESVTRSFNIAPDGRHLIAAGQKSGRLAVFRVADDGSLDRIHTVVAGMNPWWVQIIDR